jgi:uncharacterized protein YhdP
MIKRAFILVLIVLLFGGASALFLNFRTLNPNHHRAQIKAWIEERLNAEVELGTLFPIFYPGLGLECRDLVFRLKKEATGKPEDFIQVKSLKVVFDQHALFHERRLLWKELIIESPSLVLRRGPDKHFTIKDLIKPKPEKPESGPEPKGWLAQAMRDNLRAQLPDSEHRFAAIFNLERVRVSNLKLEIIDQGKPRPSLAAPLELAGIDLELHGMSADEPGQFEVSLRFPQARGEGKPDGPLLRASGRLEVDQDTRTARFSSISGTWGETKIYAGELSLSSADRHVRLTADADADVALAQLNSVLTWPPIHRTPVVDPIQAWGRARVKAHLEGPDYSQAWRMRFRASGSLSQAGLDPGRVVAPLDEFSGTAVMQDGIITIPETELKVGGIPIQASGTIEEAYAPKFTLLTEAADVDFKKFFPRRHGPPADPNAVMTPMRSRWEGDAKIGKGYYGKRVGREIQGHWSVDTDRILHFSNLTCRAYKGNYLDNFSWVSFNHPTDTVFYFNGQINKMDAQSFVEGILDAHTFVDGAFSGKGYVTGKFIRTDFNLPSLNGEFTVTVEDGKLMGYNLFVKVLKFLKFPLKEEQYGQAFERMRAKVTIRDGVAYTDDLSLKSWDLEAHAEGSIDFVHESVDLKISVYPLKALSTLTRPIPLVGLLINTTQQTLFGYYTKVEGNWNNPTISAYLPLDGKPGAKAAPHGLGERLKNGGKALLGQPDAEQNQESPSNP